MLGEARRTVHRLISIVMAIALAGAAVVMAAAPAQAADQPIVIAAWNNSNRMLTPTSGGLSMSELASHVQLSWQHEIVSVIGTFRSPSGSPYVAEGIQGGGGYLPDCDEPDDDGDCWPDVWTLFNTNLSSSAALGTWRLVSLAIFDSTGRSFVLTDSSGFTGPMPVERSPKYQLNVSVAKAAKPGKKVTLTITMRSKEFASVQWGDDDRGLYDPGAEISVRKYKSWKPLYENFKGTNWRFAPSVWISWKDSKGKRREKLITTYHKKLNKQGKLTVSFTMPKTSKVTGEVFFHGEAYAYDADFANFTVKKAKKTSKSKKTYTAAKKTYTTSKITGIKIVKFK